MSTESGTYTFEQKKSHDITVEGFEQFSSENWYMYASSSYESKRFMARPGKTEFRIFHGKELVCETALLRHAVDVYNSITSKPVDQPKLDN